MIRLGNNRPLYRALYRALLGPYIEPYWWALCSLCGLPYFPFVGCPIFPLRAALFRVGSLLTQVPSTLAELVWLQQLGFACPEGESAQHNKGSPQRENRALYRALKTVMCCDDFYKYVIKMGREYFHWVDLRLIKPMEVVIKKIDLANI